MAQTKKCLKRRHRLDAETDFAAVDSDKPYGIPIYSLVKGIEASSSREPHLEADVEPRLCNRRQPTEHFSQPPRPKKRKSSVVHQSLSEKHRAKTFFDLMGNDDANRQILRWVTYWKNCAVGSEPTLSDQTDPLGRPIRKILLLHGPPGSGKTTAAHVIANQAGFDVSEINASDERSAAVVKDRIATAISSHQVHSKRPLCIIADEIEGASEHGFIRTLLNLLKADATALAQYVNNFDYQRTKASNKEKDYKRKLLSRPIIAICNDAWAASLRNSRQHSEMVSFRRHTPARLVQRLEEICVDEKLRLTTRQLNQLAETNNFDMRACSNDLQFRSSLPPSSDSNANSSHCDIDNAEKTSWNVLVKMQFLASRPATLKQLETCSDIDKLISSCFTVYHDNNYIDDLSTKPASMGDFLALSDSRFASEEIKALVPHAFAQLFRSPSLSAQAGNSSAFIVSGKIYGNPISIFDELKQTKSILDSMLKSSNKYIRTRTSRGVALLDSMPFAVKMSKPVARSSLNVNDKVRLRLVARCLQDLGIGLRTEKLDNGSFIYRLEPPIELACMFGNDSQSEASAGEYIARSQIKEVFRESKDSSKSYSCAKINPEIPRNLKAHVVNSSTLKAEIKEKVSDFFRPLTLPTEKSRPKVSRPHSTKDENVWILYKEGFSNAVRKPVTWNELFGL